MTLRLKKESKSKANQIRGRTQRKDFDTSEFCFLSRLNFLDFDNREFIANQLDSMGWDWAGLLKVWGCKAFRVAQLFILKGCQTVAGG